MKEISSVSFQLLSWVQQVLLLLLTNINVHLVAADIACSGADGQAVVPEARPHIPHGAHNSRTSRLV